MPLMVCPNEGKLLIAQWALRSDGDDFVDYLIALYKNDVTPDNDSEFDDFELADFGGADPISIIRADFAAPVIVANQAVLNLTPAPEWTYTDSSGSQLVYGWVLYTDEDEPTVLFAQRFASARLMVNGAVEKLDPYAIKTQTLH